MKFQRVFSSIAVISCGLLFMGGCPPTPDDDYVEGYLVDSPISGANYECVEGGIGLTDEQGKFKCKNIPVTFKIGGLELGTISSLADDKKVYPQDLVGVSRENYSDDRLILLTRFLQSLDDDGVISTNIEITKELREKFTIGEFSDLSEEEIKTLLTSVSKDFVSQESALSHLRDGLTINEDTDSIPTDESISKSSAILVYNNMAQEGNEALAIYNRTLQVLKDKGEDVELFKIQYIKRSCFDFGFKKEDNIYYSDSPNPIFENALVQYYVIKPDSNDEKQCQHIDPSRGGGTVDVGNNNFVIYGNKYENQG